jgi:hypothetical protein
MEDMYRKKRERISEQYILNLKGHLAYFFKSGLKENLYKVLTVCESLILYELGLTVDSNDLIKFERRHKQSIFEYCYDVLEGEAHPMTLEQIETALKRKYPTLEISTQSLRSYLNNRKEGFIYFGRSSTYGLHKWEVERDDIKGGTIRGIVEDYLQTLNTPKHISEVSNYVIKYRPGTNVKNVFANIKQDKSNRFEFFPGEYVGLKGKSYDEDSFKHKRIIGSHFKLSRFITMKGWHFDNILEHFVQEYDYSPLVVNNLLRDKIASGKLKFSNDTNVLIEICDKR